jgi:PEP-CTERM motif
MYPIIKATHVSNAPRATLKRLPLALATSAAVLSIVGPCVHAATINYTFADLGGAPAANMEGWTSVFPGNGNIWADYTDYWGGGTPVDGGHLGDGWDAMETQLAHSPEFNLDGSGDMVWQMFGTASPASAPTSLTSAGIGPTALLGTGFMGVALRDVATDTYVLWSAWAGSTFAPAEFSDMSFTAAQLAPYANDGRAYTLDFIDNDKAPVANDHWVTLGGASIPGVAAIPEPTSLSLLALGALGLVRRKRR